MVGGRNHVWKWKAKIISLMEIDRARLAKVPVLSKTREDLESQSFSRYEKE